MLRKKVNGVAGSPRLSSALHELTGGAVDRRAFLRNSGLAIGGLAAAASMRSGMVTKAEAAAPSGGAIEIRKSVCTHCSVGCTVLAEVQDGVWIGQEPGFDSPLNLGAHCAKGASVREHAHGERRLKYPTKLAGGKWQRISWDEAINEIGDKLNEIRNASTSEAVYWLGSAKHSNEQAYLFHKLYSFWGTNNGDHQARICHSTTVAGTSNTWGYGCMTNSFNDMHNSKSMILFGSNPCEAHPVALQHILKSKEQNNAALIVCDPRFTRTAAHATEYVRFRPGSDVALVWGILYHIFENGWEDKEFLRQRVWGMDFVREEVKKWNPEEAEKVTGVPGSQLRRVARTLATNKPGTLIWCMGGTQHHNGNNNTRAYNILQLALGNIGIQGGGSNIFRGHDNVQGATDIGPLCHTLPAYYGLSKGAWEHWARVWEVPYDFFKNRFATVKDKKGKEKSLMHEKGIPVSRWADGVLEAKENIDQPDNLRAMIFWGHAVNSQTRGLDLKKALEKLDLLVVIDPYPTVASVLGDRTDNVYLLPASTQFETRGSVTASNRSLQWRDEVIKPVFESKPDQDIMYLLAKKFGFEKEMFKNIKVDGESVDVEDITREFNRGTWTIGYTGQSPERMKLHMANQHTFDRTTLRAKGGPCDGEQYGMPWPCWGTPELKHPGTQILYRAEIPVAEGGMNFRAKWGVKAPEKWGGGSLLAEGGNEGVSYPPGNELKDGHPEFTMALLKKLGWDKDLTPDEMAKIKEVGGDNIDKVSWKTDLSGGIQRVAIKHGCAPFGNGKARCVVWNFPDPVPIHREPIYTPRRDLLPKYATYSDRHMFRLPTKYASIQEKDFSGEYPLIMTSGRLVEYEGGGEETRSNPWLAELQQQMFVEINPVDANDRGIKDGEMVWVEGAETVKLKVMAMVTERVGKGVVFMPFHFGGHFQGKDLREKYPEGTDPYVLGESANNAFTYGYDSVTNMQETKVSLCKVTPA